MIIGITGRGGSGKSTLSRLICQYYHDFVYISVDELIEKYVLTSSRLLNKVNKTFTDKEYTIDDILMTYFSYEEKEQKIFNMHLEEIEKILYERIDDLGAENYVVDWYMLHELKLFAKMDIKILLTLDINKRIERIRKRNGNENIDFFIEVDNFYRENYDGKFDYVFDTSDEEYIKSIKTLCKRMSVK